VRRSVTKTIDEERLSETFAALSSSTRRAILARLVEGAATVNELADPFGQAAQYRPCAIEGGPLSEVAAWAEQYRPVWEDRLDRLTDYLSQLQTERVRDDRGN